VQFGMWLLRPRLVREYRGYMQTRADFGEYFDAILEAVGACIRSLPSGASGGTDGCLRILWVAIRTRSGCPRR